MKCFLRYEREYLSESTEFKSISAAVADFKDAALSVWRYGQKLEASLNIGENIDSLNEYPDFILSLSDRGAVKKRKT